MKKIIAPILVVACLFLGCTEPVPHYNRVSVASLVGAPTHVPHNLQGKIKPYGSVQYFQSADEVTNKYDIIAILTLSGDPGDEARFITACQYRAADLGADGIIFHRENVTGGETFNGFFIASQQIASYRAEAIRYKK